MKKFLAIVCALYTNFAFAMLTDVDEAKENDSAQVCPDGHQLINGRFVSSGRPFRDRSYDFWIEATGSSSCVSTHTSMKGDVKKLICDRLDGVWTKYTTYPDGSKTTSITYAINHHQYGNAKKYKEKTGPGGVFISEVKILLDDTRIVTTLGADGQKITVKYDAKGDVLVDSH